MRKPKLPSIETIDSWLVTINQADAAIVHAVQQILYLLPRIEKEAKTQEEKWEAAWFLYWNVSLPQAKELGQRLLGLSEEQYTQQMEKAIPAQVRKLPNDWETQGELKEVLRLKSLPREEYLKTEHWQEMRRKKLRDSFYSCSLCNVRNTRLEVHHKTYERVGEEYESDLIVLCHNCHAKFHNKLGDSQ